MHVQIYLPTTCMQGAICPSYNLARVGVLRVLYLLLQALTIKLQQLRSNKAGVPVGQLADEYSDEEEEPYISSDDEE